MKIKDGVLISIDEERDIKKGMCVIPNSVKSIGSYVFYNCSSLTNIIIPDSVKSIGYGAFYKCSGLTSITIPDSVTSIRDSAFAYCYGLTSIIIGNGVTSMGIGVFISCKNLTSVTISSGVTSIGGWAFYGCNKLKRPNISNITTIKAVKGFYKHGGKMYCKTFLYEIGKTYKERKAKLCEKGFHACTCGLDLFNYYAGDNTVYCEVELSGISPKRGYDSKICGTKITILRELTVAEAANYVSKTEV